MLGTKLFADERKQRGAVLRVMCLALMMVVGAVASLNVALPEIARDTGASQTQLQWIVAAYALAFAALLLPAGALGDRIGRKPVLAAGLGIFGISSVAAVFLNDPAELIALRGAMGVGAAMIMPVTLSVITTIFPPEERGKAVGTWVGVAAGGGVLGLLASGVLLEWLPWQSIFVLNAALAAVAVVATLVVVPATRETRPPRMDAVGTLLSAMALAAIVFGVIEGPERGWGAMTTIASLALGSAGAVAFVLWELRRREPMLDPRHFARRGFAAGTLSVTVQFFAAFGFLFLALPYLQLVMGFSPLQAAGALVPMALVVIPLSRKAPAIAARVGVRIAGATGLSLMASGFVVLSTLEVGSSYWHFLAGLLPFGAGMALAGAPATTAIVSSLPRSKQGVASAVNDVSRELGGALGIAVLGSLMNSAYRAEMADSSAGLPAGVADKAEGSLAAAEQIGEQLGPQGEQLVVHAQTAFLHGFTNGLVGGAALLLVGALFVALRAPGRAESRANATGNSIGTVSAELVERPAA
jgi:EmrB/QacA subfamily drug resistance transporter